MKNMTINNSKDEQEYLVSCTDRYGKITYANKRFCEVSRYSLEELIGKTHAILQSGYHAKEFYKNLWETITEGHIWTGIIKNKAKDGTLYWIKAVMTPILENGKPVQYICHSFELEKSKDFDELKNMESILDALDNVSIVAVTDSKGNITYVNKKFCDISKYSKDELIGKNHRMLKSGYHKPEFFDEMWKSISSGKSWSGEIKNRAKDGTFYWVRTDIIPFFSQGKIEQYVSIRTDITKEKEMVQRLLDAEKLTIVGEMAARLAHDIRNPLAVIQCSLETINLSYKMDDSFQRKLIAMDRSVDRITHQINDVLNFTRGQPLALEKTKIQQIIFDAKEMIKIPKTVNLIIQETEVEILCDKHQLAVVVNNILLNSIQAINGHGTIEIMIKERDDSIIIDIKDSGPGIPKEILPKIFEPLFTTKQKGTGLGLASVKSIIENHGGTISVKSPPTVFTINLPR